MIDSLLRKLEIPENDLPYYQYGIVSLLELISVQFLCILWAAFRHQIIDYLIFYLIFLILRKYGGGFHFKNFLPCFITSVISIIGLLELMQHIYLGIFPSALISTFSLVLIILISPVPSVVETLSQKEFQLRKHRLTIVAGILELLIILLYFTKQLHLLHVCMVTFLFMTGILITIGAGQWYGNEARTLLLNIKAADAATFKKHDTAGVAADLAKTDWSNYRLSKTSAKAKAIVNIINSTVGHRCQDQLMDTQMEAYVKEAAALGVSNMDAKMMCANFRHQGGASAVKRILAKTTKPYTLDHLYAACQTDTGNQVGAYKSRQKMVYNALKTHITNYKVTAAEAIQAAVKIAKTEIGYREKASNANLDSKTANAGTANYTKYWRDVAPEYQGQAWCACFISWVFMKAFGKATETKLLKHWPYIYVPTLAGLFTNYASPKVGDIFMYHNGSEFSHTGLVISVSGDKFVTIEGNTNDGSGVVAEGIGVYQKTRYNSQLPGSKFTRPNYSIVTSINGSGGDITPPSTWVTTGTAVCTGDDVYVRQTPGGTVMGMVSKGTKLELDGTSSGVWVHVKVAGIGIGYMHQDYVGKDSGSTGSSPIKTAQNALNSKFNAGLTVDGIWGSACKTAYIKAIQSALNSVYGAGLTADGIWGTNTSNACAAHVLSEGANNLYVGVLQIGLYAHNITLNSGIDSSFGPSTKQGVIKFQTSQGLSADGIAGRDTFARLAGV